MKTSRSGFTIVELVIVIAVIGILAAITVVAYNGIQEGAKDSAIRGGATQLVKALQSWSGRTGKTPLQTGGGYAGNGTGWVAANYPSSSYPNSIETVLFQAGYLPDDFTISLPANEAYSSNKEYSTYMLYSCGEKYVVYAYLNSPTAEDTARFDRATAECGRGVMGYHMKTAYIFD